MYFKLVRVLAIGVIAVGVLTTANAQQSGPATQSIDTGGQIVDIGKYEYDGHCAICHGLSGTGQGIEPYWNFLSKTPAKPYNAFEEQWRCVSLCAGVSNY
jgi:mono/diheme cytochrome c family protein